MRLRNYSVTCKSICSYYNLVYNFLMQLFSLESLVFVVQFLNAFRHGKETFPKSSSQNEIVPLLIVFHLPYSKYKGVKICFYSCRYQNQNFSLVSHSCCQCRTLVAFMSLVSLVFGTRVVNQTRSFCFNVTKLNFYREKKNFERGRKMTQ